MLEVKASELKFVKEFEGYHLARYQGNLGIWRCFKDDGVRVAYQLDDDCNHLLDPEWEGLFECRVMDLQAEMRALMAEGV